jgi:AmmeMemoRadiSam system protein A
MLSLSDDEKKELLALARRSAASAARGKDFSEANLTELCSAFQEQAATFVTITKNGLLRGCVGCLEPYQALALDVIEHSSAAAIRDYRFPPIRPDELDVLAFEISVLTPPRKLVYSKPQDLFHLICPGLDGVVLQDGLRRATFLPQVWEQLPVFEDFMCHLCRKMGASPDLWKQRILDVYLYQVIEFHEETS